jgi:hypothetical protein
MLVFFMVIWNILRPFGVLRGNLVFFPCFGKLCQEKKSGNPAAGPSSSSSTVARKNRRLDERMLRMRELFISDATDVYPVSVLRGKCTVHHCQVWPQLFK